MTSEALLTNGECSHLCCAVRLTQLFPNLVYTFDLLTHEQTGAHLRRLSELNNRTVSLGYEKERKCTISKRSTGCVSIRRSATSPCTSVELSIPTRNTILRWVASFRITGSTSKKKSPGRNSVALRLSEATAKKLLTTDMEFRRRAARWNKIQNTVIRDVLEVKANALEVIEKRRLKCRIVAYSIRRRFFTEATGVRFQTVPVKFMVSKESLERVSSEYFGFSCQFIPLLLDHNLFIYNRSKVCPCNQLNSRTETYDVIEPAVGHACVTLLWRTSNCVRVRGVCRNRGEEDNAPYHCIQVDKAPSPYALKGDMIEWLRKKGVECNETMRKSDLYKLILPLKPKEKTYRIDNMLSGSGHVVIRLPPYMCDLNAIELAWSKIKRIVRDTNVTGDLSLTKLRETTKNAIQEVTRQDWTGFCHHVANLEAEYWEKDGVVPDVIDQISINLNADSDSEAGGSDSENGSSSSEESE
ncbi:hypothetical protein ANN_20901 [Periplaneta americana]|uniref:Tc1-like transposase DDE domain-containing protein n=1 Tax=Periplaneta americana TaxID=6978 RepID=A0ABQ8SDW5_PERAM|nr:hypothetical protein ANN_20901 [Periplaneta americana]